MTHPHETYMSGLEAGELRFQRCAACMQAVFQPRVICNHCGHDVLVMEVSSGAGSVYSATAVSRKDQAPYSVALIDLDEGFRMMSTVVGLAADDVVIGLRVRGEFEPTTCDNEARVVFRPDDA